MHNAPDKIPGGSYAYCYIRKSCQKYLQYVLRHFIGTYFVTRLDLFGDASHAKHCFMLHLLIFDVSSLKYAHSTR